jgi:hypothetical protein
MIKKRHVPSLLVLLLISGSADGAIERRSVADRTRLASAIALGFVENTSAVEPGDGRIYADVEIRGHLVTSLGVREQMTQLRVPGGVTETRGLFVSTSPVFRKGETVFGPAHSSRSAVIGSTRVARTAGMSVAKTPTATSTIATPAKVGMSRGPIPNST